MGNYYLDTEFIEGTQKKLIGETKPTIDLISIGIVSEEGREYYAISKDFNLKEAWNRFDSILNKSYKPSFGNHQDCEQSNPMYIKEYWIRDNVLKPIFDEMIINYHQKELISTISGSSFRENCSIPFTYKNLKKLIKKYGKTNKQIANEVKAFVYKGRYTSENVELRGIHIPIRFYTYYGDYDWVVFCWLFGKMIDLPKEFPMLSIDLKQMLDSKYLYIEKKYKGIPRIDTWLKDIKKRLDYPKQENEHNALSDAKWNKKLHNFIKSL